MTVSFAFLIGFMLLTAKIRIIFLKKNIWEGNFMPTKKNICLSIASHFFFVPLCQTIILTHHNYAKKAETHCDSLMLRIFGICPVDKRNSGRQSGRTDCRCHCDRRRQQRLYDYRHQRQLPHCSSKRSQSDHRVYRLSATDR